MSSVEAAVAWAFYYRDEAARLIATKAESYATVASLEILFRRCEE